MSPEVRRIVIFLAWAVFLGVLKAPMWAAIGLGMTLAVLFTPEQPK